MEYLIVHTVAKAPQKTAAKTTQRTVCSARNGTRVRQIRLVLLAADAGNLLMFDRCAAGLVPSNPGHCCSCGSVGGGALHGNSRAGSHVGKGAAEVCAVRRKPAVDRTRSNQI